MASSPAEAMASSMETVESIPQPQEWEEKLLDEGARATPLHNFQAHEDEEVDSVLSSFAQRLKEVAMAMAKLVKSKSGQDRQGLRNAG